MNKKGDVPVTILVIGVFAVVTLAIITFVLSMSNSKSDISGYKIVEEANSIIDRYYLYKELGYSESEIENILKIEKNNLGYYTINNSLVEVEFRP